MITLLLPLLVGNFIQKWYLPRGIDHGETSVMQIVDSDRDGHLELAFTVYEVGPPYLYMYELHLPDVWQADSFLLSYYHALYGSGDFDLDGFYDFALMFHSETPSLADGITIFESPDSFSYPTQEVWRDTVGFPLVTPICVYDIDCDSLSEIIKVIGDYTDLEVYESIGNNLYSNVASIITAATHSPMSTLAFGDFDSDSQNEFVWGYSGGEYSIWECTGNNSYQEVLLQQLPTVNIKDCFAVPDADGDGKLEFVVKGYVIPSAEIHAFIFEATGDNTYEIIKTFTLGGGDYYGGYSDVGDVDGDSIPEIALEGLQTVHIIKAAGNDSFYVWETLPGNNGGSCVRVFDIDGNGLSEIIISGNNETRIYEYLVGIAEADEAAIEGTGFTIHPNPFMEFLSLEFQNPSEKGVAVRIYDVAGRLIRILHEGCKNREYTLIWHGDDEQGNAVAPGVYFVELETHDSRETKKVILLK